MSKHFIFIISAFLLDLFFIPIWLPWLSSISLTFFGISFFIFLDRKNKNIIIIYAIVLIFYSIFNSYRMIAYLLSALASIGTVCLLERKIVQLDLNIKGGVIFSLISLGLLYAYLNIIINYL